MYEYAAERLAGKGIVMVKIIVYVLGGVVQDVIADTPGVHVMVVDYDNERCEAHFDREFDEVPLNPELIAKTITGTESDTAHLRSEREGSG